MGSYGGLCASCLVACLLVTSSHASVDNMADDHHTTVGGDHEVDGMSGKRFFLHQIFSKYGDGGKMSFDGFEHLLERLGLGNIIIRDHGLDSHKENAAFHDTHDTHEHSQEGLKEYSTGSRGSPPYDHHKGHSHAPGKGHPFEVITLPLPGHRGKHINSSNRTHSSNHTAGQRLRNASATAPSTTDPHYHDSSEESDRCLSATEMLYAFDITPRTELNPNSFLLLCPAIVYELDQGHCGPRHDHGSEEDTMYQWLYASLAVLAISLCGLFSVAVIPIMQKWFYHTLLQFLVGLAVGSLTGDGMLHLMPHAMKEHSHSGLAKKPDEQLMIWRGMAALGGIFFFFVAERLLEAFTAYRRRKNEAKDSSPYIVGHPAGQLQNVVDDHMDLEVGEKLSHYRKNSYGLKIGGADVKEAIQMLPQNEVQPASSRKNSLQSNHEVSFHGRSSFSLEPAAVAFAMMPEVTVSEHHGHGHGHSHEVPNSVSAVAWMVIMGDGLHNFCDGLAIGAAFAASTAGGLSTTVAVFCHELPHELGDFAMLLKTGMKVKQALLYNGLSSVLCLIGMTIGLSLGHVESATSWVFAGTTGMFLYIALVDMLPELSTSSEPGSNATHLLAIQVLGISIGVSVMLMIAVFEPQLMEMFS